MSHAGPERQPVAEFLRGLGLINPGLADPELSGMGPESDRIANEKASGPAFGNLHTPALPPWPPLLPLVDIRSPCEFAQGHIPGAVNLPLFSDDERAEVGTLYKQAGREAAILLGLAHAGPRLGGLAEQLLALAGSGRELAVYCSRGGMRSNSIAWLASILGLRIRLLEGGYKSFRRHVLSVMEQPFPLAVLGGKTGSGKTETLRHMASLGAQIVDLEGLARHRGSTFGALEHEEQPSREHFENLLAVALCQCDPARPIWVEDECENLGRVNLPRPFFAGLRAAPVVLLETPQKARLDRVLDEYGGISRPVLAECLDRIRKRLGGLEHKRAHACLDAGDLPGLAIILMDYYDRAYTKQLLHRAPAAIVEAPDPEQGARLILVARFDG